ncbi:YibE/F family protein [Leucobacter rhizosphaerae]|uniref:YibE/F family protein n=1 Tax=Leucobacter rhizosphaerae TaxID=2932245 RepID=A0ABY4FV20_9MICO|nr:YibE/F family protein [Leucobacter rhizosphaerae]UOQ60161.1 YibE/F family protein [Leucobacter rhizosphaerae]
MFNRWARTDRTERGTSPGSGSGSGSGNRTGSGHGHGHSHDLPSSAVATSRVVRIVTFAVLAAVAIATVAGLVSLWPNGNQVSEVATQSGTTAQDVRYEEGEILGITEECATPGSPESDAGMSVGERCITASVGVRSGPDSGRMLSLPVRGALAAAGLQTGDRVELIAYTVAPAVAQDTPGGAAAADDAEPGAEPGAATDPATDAAADAPATEYDVSAANYGVSGVFRGLPLALLALLFVAVVVWIGRIRGFLALVALAVSAWVLLAFILPALVTGQPGLPVALVGSSAIMFATLYFVHGPTMRTTAALIGTLCGILIMAAISLIAVHTTRLSGIGDEASGVLSGVTTQIDFRGLLTCAIIIAGLGILNDVTITQASAVWELRAAAPAMARREIYARAMRIGRDHIASTVYTVFFSYVGAALSVLLLLYLTDRPVLSLLTKEDIAVELVRTFCGSIGLVLAVPITTWVATLFTPPGLDELPERWRSTDAAVVPERS